MRTSKSRNKRVAKLPCYVIPSPYPVCHFTERNDTLAQDNKSYSCHIGIRLELACN